jgi:hypothetical protein
VERLVNRPFRQSLPRHRLLAPDEAAGSRSPRWRGGTFSQEHLFVRGGIFAALAVLTAVTARSTRISYVLVDESGSSPHDGDDVSTDLSTGERTGNTER